jgi:hypothetical protein
VIGVPSDTPPRRTRPPLWLIASTAVLTITCLVMAVAETNLWMHYLIDAGEFVSLAGLVFITVAGIYLSRRGQLAASLPLVFPWLLFPVITQGDEIIDNLSINAMRIICHVLLAAIFATPVAVAVLAARTAAASSARLQRARWTAFVPGLPLIAAGRLREGSAVLATALMTAEMWVAVEFLGTLMVITLILMILGVLGYGFSGATEQPRASLATERAAAVTLFIGVALSLGLFVGYKNRPGAYQGSPSYYMDPAQKDVWFRLDTLPVPSGAVTPPNNPDAVKAALTGYGRTLWQLLAGYYILDRNYTYDFHNELFLRHTPLLPNYRAAGLAEIEKARRLRAEADRHAAIARASLTDTHPLAALVDDLRAYVDFNFERAATLERLTAEFERTKSGLQHAAHIYEGEGKVLGIRLTDLASKHVAVLTAPAARDVTTEFATITRAIYKEYESRIVGF